ncbi:hypothetical protein BU16DRAFT_619420 [Lophium mytilinum]|uniref:Uncharacterized protein n=1 Tax=Lophium mytilinum TaxID=390894 RepID=A0A6A6QQ45_9PEZI|nr:hypothetical protein BU16DRAFT_619420 [Lophium mytilinum]
MAPSRFFNGRNLAIFSVFTFGGSYILFKSRALAAKKQNKAIGDYSVSVDRSGGGI